MQVQKVNVRNEMQRLEIMDYLSTRFDYDFYVTENNERMYITEYSNLLKLFKNSDSIYIYEDGIDIRGLVLVWRSYGGGKKRRYVKIHAENSNIATKLLTVLTWNSNTDLFVKIRKDSKYLQSFKSKGFRFVGGRGIQLLLKRKNYKTLEEREYE